MAEFSISIIPKKPNLSTLLLSHFSHFCSFILSHPLYLFYFIFFFPYLLKLLSFLSPLFITTSLLLLLAYFTISPINLQDQSLSDFTESKMGFLATTYQVVYESLRPKVDEKIDEFQHDFEELEAYKTVFEAYTFETKENDPVDVPEVEIKVDNDSSQSCDPVIQEKTELRSDFCREAEQKYEAEKTESYRVEEEKEKPCFRSGSKKKTTKTNGFTSVSEENHGSFGSMRKEKEWRRTLACKLFEERHNGNGGSEEGMDLLWETYETDSNNKISSKNNSKKGKKNGVQAESINEEEQEEEEEIDDGQLCCLQALKFSTGKMNLGMGRPNLVKISKALKGFGWFHHVSKHSKKNYN